MNLYQKTLMDHYHHPQNYGQLDNAHFTTQLHNPSCGDLLSMQGIIEASILVHVRFIGKGCIISQATASLLTQEYSGKNITDILALTATNIQTLIGIPLGPLRLKCALLPLDVLQDGIRIYQKNMN